MTPLLLALVFASLVVHELAHGWAAYLCGDETAKRAGRLSPNPLRHVDPVLTIILPALVLLVTHGTMCVGGGKPIPVNRLAMRHGWRDYLLVILAGPASNLALCVVAAALGLDALASVNLALAVINLLPIPFLDGGNAVKALRHLWLERRTA